jgi:hypothetical protein
MKLDILEMIGTAQKVANLRKTWYEGTGKKLKIQKTTKTPTQ